MSSSKPKVVVPPAPQDNNSAVEQVQEKSSVSSSKRRFPRFPLFLAITLNKFKAKRDYFAGSGHSLQQTERSASNQRCAFRREDNSSFNNDTNAMYDNKFTEKDKSVHFSGKGHKLC